MSDRYVPCGLPDSTRSPELPPNTNTFQNGTAKVDTAVWFQRCGPNVSGPDPFAGLDQVMFSIVSTCRSSNCCSEFQPPHTHSILLSTETAWWPERGSGGSPKHSISSHSHVSR